MPKDGRTIEGGQAAGVKLKEFLVKEVKSFENEGDIHLKLVQKAKTGEMSVAEYDFALDENLDDLINEIIDAAETDAELYRKKTRYAVRIVGSPTGKYCAFTLNVPMIDEDEEDELAEFEELPNRKGIVAQSMRHSEQFAKDMLQASRMGRDDLYRQNRELQQENTELRRLYMQQVKIYEDLRSMQFARELELKKMEGSEKRKEKAADMFMKSLPLLASKILGTSAEELGGETVTDQMLDQLIAGLENNPDKIQKIMSVLDPVEIGLFAEIHRRIMEKRAAQNPQNQQSQQDNHQNGVTNPQPPQSTGFHSNINFGKQ